MQAENALTANAKPVTGVRNNGRNKSGQRIELGITWHPGENCALFAISAAVYLAVAYLLVVPSGLILTGSMDQVVRGWFAVSGESFRFAALGPGLPPLPVLLQLPFLLIPSLQGSTLPAIYASAGAGALSCVVLNHMLAGMDFKRRWRYVFLAAYGLNPLVLLHAASGSPQLLWTLLIVASVDMLLTWYRSVLDRPLLALAAIMTLGFSVGFAFLVRFDTLIYSLLLLPAVAYLGIGKGPSPRGRIEGLLITYFVPVTFSMGIWALYNMLVAGDAFGLSKNLFMPAGWPTYLPAKHPASDVTSLSAALSIGGTAIQLFPMFAISWVLLLVDCALRRRKDSLVMAAIPPALFAASVFSPLAAQGGSVIHLLLPIIPLAVAFAAQCCSGVTADREERGAAGSAVRWLCLMGLVISSAATGVTMATSSSADQTTRQFLQLPAVPTVSNSMEEEKEIARFLVTNVKGHAVLIDDAEAYPIVFYTKRPELFVAPFDPQFPSRDAIPAKDWRYVLVRDSNSNMRVSTLDRVFPYIYDAGAEGTVLVADWPNTGWRLLRFVTQQEVPQ